MFACSERVTLIGQTTGGGSCVVIPLTTASGSIIQISGFKQISATKNGSFYNADHGVEPDFKISKYEHFYDRIHQQLTVKRKKRKLHNER